MACAQILPYILFPDSIFEVVMISVGTVVIYTQHEEKHAAVEKQISGGKKNLCHSNHAGNYVDRLKTHLTVLSRRASLLLSLRVFLSSAGAGGRTRRR